MQGYLLIAVLLWVSTALETAWPLWLRAAYQPPHLVVAVVACTGLLRGAVDGCFAGLLGAVLLAGAGHIPLGGLSAGLILVGAGAGMLRGTLFAERATVAILVSVAGLVVSEVVRMIFLPPLEFAVWLRALGASVVLTALISPLAFWSVLLTRRREPGLESVPPWRQA
jgi:hypothetical protein